MGEGEGEGGEPRFTAETQRKPGDPLSVTRGPYRPSSVCGERTAHGSCRGDPIFSAQPEASRRFSHRLVVLLRYMIWQTCLEMGAMGHEQGSVV